MNYEEGVFKEDAKKTLKSTLLLKTHTTRCRMGGSDMKSFVVSVYLPTPSQM